MTTRMVLTLGVSALVLGGTMVGCTANGGGVASASARDTGTDARAAAANADKAARALAKRDVAIAVPRAEAAVALAPRSAEYRSLLGRSYLQAGRFTSARAAFADALSLRPGDGRVALNLALSQVATGDWQGARATLAANQGNIPAADLGLAVALSGDPANAVSILTSAARTPGADAKVRQNLALALALAGEWQGARVVAAADMSPADVDARLAQWAIFARPAGTSDQVASLLGVRPVPDTGLPIALALVAPVQVAEAVVPEKPVPVAVASVDTSAIPTPDAPMGLRFAAPVERATLIRPARGATKVAVASIRPAPTSGQWYVQLGAFKNAGAAKDAWAHATRRDASFRGRTPTGMNVSVKGAAFYRLSVGGFARGDADGMCKRYRAVGGACFVRAGAGDRMAQWLRPNGAQVASR